MPSFIVLIVYLSTLWGSPVVQDATFSYYGSYYDTGIHRTANGAVYARNKPTVAVPLSHRHLLGSFIAISSNGKVAVAWVNDVCPACLWPRLDLPDGFWQSFGWPQSKGVFKGSILIWRQR